MVPAVAHCPVRIFAVGDFAPLLWVVEGYERGAVALQTFIMFVTKSF